MMINLFSKHREGADLLLFEKWKFFLENGYPVEAQFAEPIEDELPFEIEYYEVWEYRLNMMQKEKVKYAKRKNFSN